MLTAAQSVFRSRAFSLFYAGQAFSYVGDGLRTIAIPLLIYHLTRSPVALGITYALEFFPFTVFGLVGGSLADRLDRRKLMIRCDLIRFVVVLAWVLAYSRGFLSLWMLYAGIGVGSLCAAVFMGGQASSIPYLLGKERATRGVAALSAAEQAAWLVTPPLGAAIFSMGGPLPALVINAGTYLCSQLSIAAIDTLGPSAPSGLPTWREIGSDIEIGFRYLWSDAAMLQLTLVGMLFNLFGLMTQAVFIPFLKVDFGASDLTVGYAFGVSAIGAVIGSLVAGAVPSRWPLGRILTWSYVLDGLLFAPVMFAHQLWVVMLFSALSNATFLFEVALIVGWRMRVIPQELVGRVFGAVRFVVLLGMAPGALIGGALADHYGARLPIVVSGLGYLAAAVLLWFMPAVRRERR